MRWLETFESVDSVLSIRSHHAELSVLSSSSILSFASAGSILSIGSAGSALSLGSVGSLMSRWSLLSVGGRKERFVYRARDRAAIGLATAAVVAALARH